MPSADDRRTEPREGENTSETLGGKRLEEVKDALRRLHAGEQTACVREELRQVLSKLGPEEISRLEQELVKEGVTRQELQRLCDVHLELFRESLEGTQLDVPDWHPLHILLVEHERILQYTQELRAAAEALTTGGDQTSHTRAQDVAHHLLEAESHLVREENVLFPQLERQGITEPPAVMWMEHDQLRGIKREIRSLLEEEPAGDKANTLLERATALAETYAAHIYKENNILYPTALRVIPEEEWPAIRAEFDELGYCCFTPERAPGPAVEPSREETPAADSVRLGPGELSPEELDGILNALPVDITFVGADDTVRYFNETKDRIFVRSRSVIGRNVQQCHPQKSVHVVERILSDFKSGKRDVAQFWIPLAGKLVHIRYYPVRGADGRYLGTMEVTQDIAPLKEIDGERRLLDEPGEEG